VAPFLSRLRFFIVDTRDGGMWNLNLGPWHNIVLLHKMGSKENA
jgi:hypothetical protein